MLVPHVFGPTHSASASKPVSLGQKWNETLLFEALRAKEPLSESVAKQILDWAKSQMLRITWGQGSVYGSFVPVYHHDGRDHPLFAVYTNCVVETYFYWYQQKPPFESEARRLEILQRLNNIEGVSIPADGIKKRPSIKLSILAAPGALENFLAVFDWMIEEIKKS